LYAHIAFGNRRYLARSNSCASRLSISSLESSSSDSRVVSVDLEYVYIRCTLSLKGCTHLKMKLVATIWPSIRVLSNNPSNSCTCTISALVNLANQLSCCSRIWLMSHAASGSYSCCSRTICGTNPSSWCSEGHSNNARSCDPEEADTLL
jgi:hypothetical protein